MDTKGIDLTQCNNCRFRAVVDGKEVTGRIEKPKTNFLLTGDEWFGCAVTYLELATLRGGTDLITDDGNFRISGFEIVPRDPETYKDWQVEDIIGFEDENGEMDIIPEHLCKVIFRSGELVAIAENCEDADINGVYTCGQIYREGWRLILTDIEKRIIEKRKEAEWEPQDGDIIAFGYKAIGIFRNFDQSGLHSDYVTLSVDNLSFNKDGWIFDKLRPATEEEKQKLFDAMAKEGKRWNAEKKVVEDIPKPHEFKKGEPVLVRDYENSRWLLAAYSGEDSVSFLADTGKSVVHWKYCIPYNERTMHLLGTTEDYKED